MVRTVGVVLVAVLLGGCARTLLGTRRPLQPWPDRTLEVVVTREDGWLRLDPARKPGRLLVFLHGFATTPAQYEPTLRALAAQGFSVRAPELPDYFLGRIGFHRAVLEEARRAYARVAKEAAVAGQPKPFVVGFSMGAGAGYTVAAEQGATVVLWAVNELDVPKPRLMPRAPLLLVIGKQDCIVKDRPEQLAAALGERAEVVRVDGNHLGFTDLTGLESQDCGPAVARDDQRRRVQDVTVEFFARQGP